MTEVDELQSRRLLGQMPAQIRAIAGLQPLVVGDEADNPARLAHRQRAAEEVHEQVRRAIVDQRKTLLPVRLVRRIQPLLPHIRRIADNDIESALLEYVGEGFLPVERFYLFLFAEV